MKRLFSWLVSVAMMVTMVTTFVACGEKKETPLVVTVEVSPTATTPCGTNYKVADPVVKGTEKYDLEVSVAAASGSTVNYNEETKSFYAKDLGADAYTITYTVAYKDLGETKTAAGVTKLSTTDGEKPTISAPDYVTGVRGSKVEIPQATVVDNSGESITAAHVVRDDSGAAVTPVKENGKEYVQISETAKWYTVTYSAADSSGNAATEHDCKIWIRSSANEVEFFDTEDLVDVTTESSTASVVAAKDAPQGGKGNVLKVNVPEKDDANSGYVSITLRNLGVTDFTNVTKLKMKVYSTIALSNYPEWHAGNSLVPGKLNGGSAAGKNVAADTWTELVWTRAQVQEMFNGAEEGKYQRPALDEVTELRFDLDNAGWWGEQTEADGGGTQWKSQSFVLYIDDIEVQQMDLNWKPVSYETDAATVYEINSFNDDARFELLNILNSDTNNFKLSLSDEHTFPFNPDAPEEDNKSLKVEVTSYDNGFPRFVVSLEKLAGILDLSALPDNAVFKMTVYVESSGKDKVVVDGHNNLVFYEKGNPAEKKPNLTQGLWIEVGQTVEAVTSVKNMKEASLDLGELDSAGFFFYADKADAGTFTSVVYFDNFRIEVPKN